MAWEDTLVLMLQLVINDLDATDYTTNQLELYLALAAIQVNEYFKDQWPIGGPYVIDMSIPDITPDPTLDPGLQGFANLVVIKAAEILTRSELKKAGVSAGYKITDDKSSIDTTGAITALKERLAAFVNDYETAKKEYESGNAFAGAAILSPYVPPGDMNLAQFTAPWQRGC